MKLKASLLLILIASFLSISNTSLAQTSSEKRIRSSFSKPLGVKGDEVWCRLNKTGKYDVLIKNIKKKKSILLTTLLKKQSKVIQNRFKSLPLLLLNECKKTNRTNPGKEPTRPPEIVPTIIPTNIPTVSSTPTLEFTPTNTPSPRITEVQLPIATSTPTPTPTLVHASIINTLVVIPKISSSSNSSLKTIPVNILCPECPDDVQFSIDQTTSSGPVHTVQAVGISSLLDQSQNKTFSQNLNVQVKPLTSGTSTISLKASLEHVVIDNSISIKILSDEESNPNSIVVNSTLGNDNFSGSFQAPLKTFGKAVLNMNAWFQGNPNTTKIILLGSGTHFVSYPLIFQQWRTGASGSLKIAPLNNAKPKIFLGEKKDSSLWEPLSDGTWRHCSLGNVSTASDTYEPITLYVGDYPLVPARYPDVGFLNVVASQSVCIENCSTNTKVYETTVTLENPNLPSINEADIGVHILTSYRIYKEHAKIVNNQLKFKGAISLADGAIVPGSQLYLEGSPKYISSTNTISSDNRIVSEYAIDGACVRLKAQGYDPRTHETAVSLPQHNQLLQLENLDTNNMGSLVIEGIQFAGGVAAKSHGFNAVANSCTSITEHALIILNSGTKVSLYQNRFGPSGMTAIEGIRDTTQIDIRENIFSDFTGRAVSISGPDMRETPSAHTISITQNIIQNPHPNCLNSQGVNLAWVGDSTIESNYFSQINRVSIGVSADRYLYAALKWCMKQGLTESQCKSSNVNDYVPSISWDEVQKYIPVRNVLVKNNFIDGGHNVAHDSGFIYTNGIGFSQNGDPSVLIEKNVILNKRAAKGSEHIVGIYNDDASNSVDLLNNIFVSPKGSSYPIYAKGRGGVIDGNIVYSSESSSSAMISFAEFDSIKPEDINGARFLEVNKELNREKSLINNAFIQFPDEAQYNPAEKTADFMFFSNWEPSTDDGYGYMLNESSGNIFMRTTNQNISASVRVRPTSTSPGVEQFALSISEWKNKAWRDNRKFDATSTESTFNLPSADALMAGQVIPPDSSYEHLIGQKIGMTESCLRYTDVCPESASFTLDSF